MRRHLRLVVCAGAVVALAAEKLRVNPRKPWYRNLDSVTTPGNIAEIRKITDGGTHVALETSACRSTG